MAIIVLNLLPFYVPSAFITEQSQVVNTVRPAQKDGELPTFESSTRSLSIQMNIPVAEKIHFHLYNILSNLIENASQFLSLQNYETVSFWGLTGQISTKIQWLKPQLAVGYFSPTSVVVGGIVSNYGKFYNANNKIMSINFTIETLVLDDFNRKTEIDANGTSSNEAFKVRPGIKTERV